MNTKIYSRYLHWEEYLNFKIYIFLIIFCIFAESVIADDFVELKPVLVEGRVDLGNTLKGKEYFFLLEIPDVKGPEISKVSTSCACLQILEYTKEKAAGNFRVSLVYIPVKNGSFKTSLDLDLEGGIQKKVVLHSEVLGDDAKTVTVGLENKLLKRELVSYNKKLYVDLNKVLTSSQKFTFIDIRDRKSYSQLRIPESLNLQPSDLLSSPFFKSKIILLVNQGVYSSWLEKECMKLRKRGLKSVFILKGGIQAWSQKRKLDGLANAHLKNSISFTQFFDLKNFTQVKFVYSEDSNFKIRNTVPYAKSIQEISTLKTSDDEILIFLDQPKDKYSNAFYLDGSISEFQKFLSIQLEQVLGGKVQTTRKGCPGCPN